jgi:hypothetical protein
MSARAHTHSLMRRTHTAIKSDGIFSGWRNKISVSVSTIRAKHISISASSTNTLKDIRMHAYIQNQMAVALKDIRMHAYIQNHMAVLWLDA